MIFHFKNLEEINLKLIISQKYKNKNNWRDYIIVSIKGDKIIVKEFNGSAIYSYSSEKFEDNFFENFNIICSS